MIKKSIKYLKGTGKGSFRIQRILIAGLSSLGSKAVNMLLLLISVPLTYNYLGEERFGVLMTILAAVAMLNFADMGLGFGLLNRIPEYQVNNEPEKLKSAISSTFSFLSCIAIVSILVIILFFNKINWFDIFNVESITIEEEVDATILYFLLCFFITLPFTLITKIQGGFQEYHINSYWEAGGNLFSLITLLISVQCKAGISIILLSLYGSKCLFIIFNFLNFFFLKRKNLMPSIQTFDSGLFKSIFKEGILFFILQFCAMLTVASDNFIITQKLGPESVAIFAIGYRLFSVFMMPVQVFIGPTLPAYNDAIVNKDFKWLNEMTKQTIKLILITSIAFSLCYYFAGNWIINIWISKDINLSNNLLLGFAFYILYFNLNGFFSTIMLSRPMLRFCAIIYPITAITCFILKIYMIDYLGTSGLLWANILAFTFIFFLPSVIIFKNYINNIHDPISN